MDVLNNEKKLQAIKNVDEYVVAKNRLDDIKESIANMAMTQSTYKGMEEDWEADMQNLHTMKDIEESHIDEYLSNLPGFSSKYLGSNIKYILKKYGLKISDLENMLSVSAGYISRTLNEESKKRLSIDIAWQISKIFSVNIDELLNMDFCEPPKTVLPVIQFIEKLKHDTSNNVLFWKNNGMQPTKTSCRLFSTLHKTDGDEESIYGPQGFSQETGYLSLRGDIYSTKINGSHLLFVPVEEYLFGNEGYEFYVVDSDDELPFPDLQRLCCTLDDATGTLNAKAQELFNSIKLHEADFVVSDTAKSFIDNYLHPYNPNGDLPFN